MSKFKKIGRLFGFGQPKQLDLPPAPAPLPTPDDANVERAGEKTTRRARRRRGLQSTIQTTGAGDTSQATVRRTTLLGGGS